MTSKQLTSPLPIAQTSGDRALLRDRLFTAAFATIQWPWLLRSLYGGSRREKAHLLERLDLPVDALPHLGSWKADTYLLHRLVDIVRDVRPSTIVELGSGATTLVLAQALEQVNPAGELFSYDQNAQFVADVDLWLREHGLSAHLMHAPLSRQMPGWFGCWYDLKELPPSIDLLVIDGPPWSVHPFVRGAAETLFTRLSQIGVIVMDDASRPGERVVAGRWSHHWPDIRFERESAGSKGLLIGTRR